MLCRRSLSPGLLLGLALVLPAGAAVPAASGFRFTSFELPVQDLCQNCLPSFRVRAYNANGTVVGHYIDTQNRTHGFIRLSNGDFTVFDPPGASNTFLTGVNDAGVISGYWTDPAGNATTFARKVDGMLVTRTISGAVSILSGNLNNLGQIVATYQGAGVLFDSSGGYTLVTAPIDWAGSRGLTTSATGINDAGQIVGSFCAVELSGCNFQAFYRDASGKFAKLPYSWTTQDTTAGAISNDGQLVISDGRVGDISGNTAYIAYPGAQSTSPTGVVAGGGIAGIYTLAGASSTTTHGFVATPCAVVIATNGASFDPAGGTGHVDVIAPEGCSWNSHTEPGFVTVNSGASGTGNGTLAFTVAANTGAARQLVLNVAGKYFSITQGGAGCGVALGATTGSAFSGGALGELNVTAPAACAWTAVSGSPEWLVITSGSSGTGVGKVTYTALPNSNAAARTGTLTVNGQTFTLTQAGGAACTFVLAGSNSLGSGGGAGQVTITTQPGCAWIASSDASWLAIDAAAVSGVGNGVITYQAAANTTTTPRIVHVSAGTASYPITQAAPSGCTFNLSQQTLNFLAIGGIGMIDVATIGNGCTWTATSNATWITINGVTATRVTFNVDATTQGRNGTITVAGQTVTVTQAGQGSTCNLVFGGIPPIDAAGGTGSLSITVAAACPWQLTSSASWLLLSPAGGTGAGSTTYVAQPNPSITARSVTITAGSATLQVQQDGRTTCSVSANPSGLSIGNTGGSVQVAINTDTGCAWSATSNAAWVTITGNSGTGSGTGTLSVSISANNTGAPRFGTITVADQTLGVTQTQATATRFVPITPCRIADTRFGQGKTGAFGPAFLAAGAVREIPVPLSGCGVPGTAMAYSLNTTVVPYGPLGYLTVWPLGQARPLASNLNAPNGTVVANAAIVPAGGGGGISLFASDPTEVIVDINGYFVGSDSATALAFYPLAPCRVLDTRAGQGKTGAFGPPSMPTGGSARSVPVPQSSCNVPANAAAYSMNFTVVPTGKLGYLSTWPTGQAQPLVSTLNSWDGAVLANAAVVPAGDWRLDRLLHFAR